MTTTPGPPESTDNPSPTHLMLRRFGKNTRALICLLLLVLIGLATVLVPIWSPHPYDEPDWNAIQGRPPR